MKEVATISSTVNSAAMLRPMAPASKKVGRRLRLVPLAIAALTMAIGICTGLARLGIALPHSVPAIADLHGALMICGFLGTLISLERAVALDRRWPYAAPALSS